ncbi:uncharacterized protein LOC126092181 [Schistocerca cancellata]|uniref:uncharacterized protein LOC126092181 n=1 Tax=Schistocerca cancellata TaxID=274614 RepID=UPI0021173CF0|nr:uncharacterized protein LOC126092181 [Schistocerca cancellata]
MERGPKVSWLCKVVKSVNVPADVLKLQRYLNKCSDEVPVIEKDTLEQFDRILRNVLQPFESNAENHTYLMVILNFINFLSQKNCFAVWVSPNYELQPEFCTKFAVLMKNALKYIASYIIVDDKYFLTLLSVFKEIVLKSAQHIYLKNVFLRALSYSILKLIICGKVEFPLKKMLVELMVNLLEGTDRQARSETFYKVKPLLCMILQALHKYGDYKTQMSVVEIIIRFTILVPHERLDIAKSIQNEEICQCFATFSPRNFETECRNILNLLNQAYGQNSNVFTIACDKAFVGNHRIKKPEHEDYKELWIDFNLDSQSITVCCDGDSLMWAEENHMPEQSGYWEVLTITSKNVRKLSIVPSDGSFPGKDDVSLMHMKLASPCDYIQATSTAVISRCREFRFYFKQSPEFNELQNRILPQIFRGRQQEKPLSVTPQLEISLNSCQILEQNTRGKSGQLAKNDQESNEVSLRNSKNIEGYKVNSCSEGKGVIGASEKLGDDPEKQLESLHAELLKEIMQESKMEGIKHTQITNSSDGSLKVRTSFYKCIHNIIVCIYVPLRKSFHPNNLFVCIIY